MKSCTINVNSKNQVTASDLIMKLNLKLSIICIIALTALVTPTLAINNATVHGEVYSSDTFEPLDNAIVYVNSTPAQFMVAKSGLYSFELEPGNYTITAEYYQNSTLTYSAEETVTIKDGGNYVVDLLLLPVYSKELMGNSEINASLENSTSNARSTETEIAINKLNSTNGANSTEKIGLNFSNENFSLIALIVILLLVASYPLFKKHNKLSKKPREEEIEHIAKELSRSTNSSKISVNIPNERIDTEFRPNFHLNMEETVSKKGQETELEPEIKEDDALNEMEPANHPEKIPDPRNKLFLPADLQEIMEIIRGQGGRITQKGLRSRLKYSEGKVSLMLADLERRELIEKFKKGRENIIILKDRK